MTTCYPKEHDLLKLCDNYGGEKIHYCPYRVDRVIGASLNELKGNEGFKSLRHHCILKGYKKKHVCDSSEVFPVSREELFLALADVKASVISRKLHVGYRKGPRKEERSIWDTYHVWVNKEIGECRGQEPLDVTILDEIGGGLPLGAIFAKRADQALKRSEDAWACPFASLMTHSELTERWFRFFTHNPDYFGVPETIPTLADARKLSTEIQGSASRKQPRTGVPITFVRLKLFANQNLSRIADTEIIERISGLVRNIPTYFEGSEALYCLYDEIILVMPAQASDTGEYIENILRLMKGFTPNYYFEGNYATTHLLSKGLLTGFDKLFKPFENTFYPPLDDTISPDYAALGEDNEEAYRAKLCELCNMAAATRTFRKFNDAEQSIHECLCDHCYKIRDRQKRINEALQEGREAPHGIGYKIGKWELKSPEGKLCFLKVDLNLGLLNDVLKDTLLGEFPLRNPTDVYHAENIGFSIIYEFLRHYEQFLAAFKTKLRGLDRFSPSFVDDETGVSNEFDILDNFLCLRFKEISEMQDVMRIFADTYKLHFPQFTGMAGGKNRNISPITLSATISNLKFPFFEAWRYLNTQKEEWMNILATRGFELSVSVSEYEKLSEINVQGERVKSFLHKLADIFDRTGSYILLNTEIFNNQREQSKIFQGIMKRYYSVDQLINFSRLVKRRP
jgi:hypothetical protein